MQTTRPTIDQIELAMMKIAQTLPDNPALGLIWSRLEAIWTEAKEGQDRQTAEQASAAAWLASRQNDMGAKRSAMP
ncbi:hypothetical protein [Roseivivax sp. THAF30]|uniref:hypothetical protein n=1 Tax=Roseivivax sp. THAF30 TaxID=2587852 RepID=UPI001267D292|nr:hypothetical protein [Roseivivax sp. THAF30]QFT64587.1 hypothetical protein FIU91_16740 [Roseivivax sp. THAF30]